MDDGLTLLFHHVHNHFHRTLPLAGNAVGGFLGGHVQQPQRHQKQQHGEYDCVVVDNGEINN